MFWSKAIRTVKCASIGWAAVCYVDFLNTLTVSSWLHLTCSSINTCTLHNIYISLSLGNFSFIYIIYVLYSNSWANMTIDQIYDLGQSASIHVYYSVVDIQGQKSQFINVYKKTSFTCLVWNYWDLCIYLCVGLWYSVADGWKQTKMANCYNIHVKARIESPMWFK